MRSKLLAAGSGGFTLLEILVVLVMLGLMIGAIVPNIISQTSKGEINRIVRDMATVEDAAKNFRVDLTRWPGDLEDLQSQPNVSGTDADINGIAYPTGLANRWSGPYLESVELVNDSLYSAAGARMHGFTKDTYEINGVDYLVLTITELSADQIDALDQEVDGSIDAAAGRLRFVSSTAFYLAAPLQ
jgi:type II secretion system protein G